MSNADSAFGETGPGHRAEKSVRNPEVPCVLSPERQQASMVFPLSATTQADHACRRTERLLEGAEFPRGTYRRCDFFIRQTLRALQIKWARYAMAVQS